MSVIQHKPFTHPRVQFLLNGNTEERKFRQRLPSGARICKVLDYLDGKQTIETKTYQVEPNDILVYSVSEQYEEGPVYSAPVARSLPEHCRILAVYSTDQKILYSLWGHHEWYPGLSHILNKIEMALGARGVYV
jgi:hypothetical protein